MSKTEHESEIRAGSKEVLVVITLEHFEFTLKHLRS